MSSSALEDQLAALVVGDAPDPTVPELDQAARHLADLIGVSLAGVGLPEFERLRGLVPHAAPYEAGAARIWGTPHWAPRREAGLLDGFAGHVHDFDDDEVEFAMAHVTVTAMTAAIVCADSRPDLGGHDVLVAYLIATEAAMRIGEIVNPDHYRKGWHASATLGTFAACAAAGRLLGISAPQMRHGLGMCASLASGLRANFGSDTKALQVGQSVRNGIFAAEAAIAGMTSTAGALFGPAGFGALFQQGRDAEAIPDAFGKPYRFLGGSMAIKAYPCCTATHTAIFALLALRAEHGFSADRIAAITCHVDPTVPGILIHDRPVTAMEAKFSMEYCVAIAATAGSVGIEQFSEEMVHDPAVRALMGRVRIVCDPHLPKGPSGTSMAARVEVAVTTGETYRRFQQFVPGSASQPLGDGALRDKFIRCAACLPAATAARAFDALLETGAAPSFADLLDHILPMAGDIAKWR